MRHWEGCRAAFISARHGDSAEARMLQKDVASSAVVLALLFVQTGHSDDYASDVRCCDSRWLQFEEACRGPAESGGSAAAR